MKLLLATKNPGKAGEMREVFSALRGVDILTLQDIGATKDVEETGETFEENAILKATFWQKETGYCAVADDGGLEIDALGGEPGVKSRRWPGYEADDETLVQMALAKLQGVPLEKRTARLRTVVALAFPDGRTETATEAIKGVIREEPSEKRDAGYPFRSLFWLPEIQKFYIDLTDEEHTRFNHRRRALEKIAKLL